MRQPFAQAVISACMDAQGFHDAMAEDEAADA